MRRLTVVRPGALTLVEDRGRPGLARFGVGVSGAMDREALALANRLVGNGPDAAGLEILLGDASFRADGRVWIVVAGAWGDVSIGDRPVHQHTATLLEGGQTIRFRAAERGIRYYLAVRGGIDVAPVLGSRSWDTLAQLGPAPLAEGDVLPVGPDPIDPVPPVDLVPVGVAPETVTLDVRPGPRRDWFNPESWDAVVDHEWRVSPRSDRTGIRVDGPRLERSVRRELPSEGMLPGAVQVSPDGAPTILAADHPVTGGYPVIAVVGNDSLDLLAQLRPGQGVRFRPSTRR